MSVLTKHVGLQQFVPRADEPAARAAGRAGARSRLQRPGQRPYVCLYAHDRSRPTRSARGAVNGLRYVSRRFAGVSAYPTISTDNSALQCTRQVEGLVSVVSVPHAPHSSVRPVPELSKSAPSLQSIQATP